MTAKLLLATFCSLALSIPVARACGGFFCTTVPMNQVAETILFIQGEAKVTTHVQIQYSGTAADFAWILPVPAVPELAVSHNQIFTQLQRVTQPSFQLNFQEDVSCGFPPIPLATAEDSVGLRYNVDIASEERVGPYDTAVISSDDAKAVVSWLVDNGYQLGDLGVELLTPYVEEGFYFLALKLAPDRDVGDLQPIALTYAAEVPGIPIRLTAVATEPDLGILTYVLGEHRAVPTNYRHVQINKAAINWFFGGFNYQSVVTQAANEAGGQAFVTEYAGPSEIVGNFFFATFDIDKLRQQDHPADFLAATRAQGFPNDAQMQTLIRRHIPMPPAVLTEGVLEVVFAGDREAYEQARKGGWLQNTAESSFYSNMRAYESYLADLAFDANAFADDLQRIVVEPLTQVQEVFAAKPYLTRLYTTLSADEMTLDPMFSYNPDLPEVSNVHAADAYWDCADPETTPLEEWDLVVTLADGREFRTFPFTAFGRPAPRARRCASRRGRRAANHLRPAAGHPLPPHGSGSYRRSHPDRLVPLAQLPQPLQCGHDLALYRARLRTCRPTHLQSPRAEGAHPHHRPGRSRIRRDRLGWPRPQRPSRGQRRVPLSLGNRRSGIDAQVAFLALGVAQDTPWSRLFRVRFT